MEGSNEPVERHRRATPLSLVPLPSAPSPPAHPVHRALPERNGKKNKNASGRITSIHPVRVNVGVDDPLRPFDYLVRTEREREGKRLVPAVVSEVIRRGN